MDVADAADIPAGQGFAAAAVWTLIALYVSAHFVSALLQALIPVA